MSLLSYLLLLELRNFFGEGLLEGLVDGRVLGLLLLEDPQPSISGLDSNLQLGLLAVEAVRLGLE